MKRILPECPRRLIAAVLLAASSFLVATPSARANVYASGIKLNGGFTNVTANAGDSLSVSYILNERASRGVTIDFLRGSTLARRLSFPANSPGAERGLNTVVWDLRDASSNSVPPGTYHVNITAAARGYAEWTQISSESDPNTYVYDGRGISVEQNPANPYFGRVFVANSAWGVDPANSPGDVLGILKFNADGSVPDEGITGPDGHAWPGNELGPWKVESAGDYVYANDLALNGQVFRWDPTISSNSLVPVLGQNNQITGASLSGLAITKQGTNTHLWMADRASNLGVVRWTLDTNGLCVLGDTGTTVVGLGSDPTGLTLPAQDVALDHAGNIYVCQSVGDHANPLQRVFRYLAYDPSTNGGLPAVTSDWSAGGGDDTYGSASGISVDPTGTYVAVAFQGVTVFGLTEKGNTKILYATNGAVAAKLNLDVSIGGYTTHQDTDCAWDAAGNVYYIDNYLGRWRAVSPPGTNQTVTVAPAAVLVPGNTTPPEVTGISVTNDVVTITFTGSPSDSANAFVVLASASPAGPFTIAQSATISSYGPGLFKAVLPVSGSTQFYRVERRLSPPPQEPQILGITVNTGIVNITFAGASTDAPSAFTLISADSVSSAYTPVADAQIISVSAGTFRATASTNGPTRFYRVQR